MQEVTVKAGDVTLIGFLTIPEGATKIVLFSHGSGSGRHSPRNQSVAKHLNEAGIATLLLDLLTANEEEVDVITREYRFNMSGLGYVGASTGAAAALIAAEDQKKLVNAVVSRGGRPDLAGNSLPRVVAPTLLIVGGDDLGVIELNKQAFDMLQAEKKLEIVPHATHLFEEPGTLEEVAKLATGWFLQYL